MADPKKFQPRLVDDSYVAKQGETDPESVKKAGQAALVREGRRRQLEADQKLIALAHNTLAENAELKKRPTADSLAHAKRAAHRSGMLLGSAWGFAACLIVGALWMAIGAEMFGRNAATGSMIARQADDIEALEALDGP